MNSHSVDHRLLRFMVSRDTVVMVTHLRGAHHGASFSHHHNEAYLVRAPSESAAQRMEALAWSDPAWFATVLRNLGVPGADLVGAAA